MGITRDEADTIVRLASNAEALRAYVDWLVDEDSIPDGTFYGYVECSGCGRPCDTLDDGTRARLALEGWRWEDETFTAARCPDCGDDQSSGIRESSPGEVPSENQG